MSVFCLNSPPILTTHSRARSVRLQIKEWATTIACCYSGVLKLSQLSQPATVYRGVREDQMQLPKEMVAVEEMEAMDRFAGGIERAFMSTTKNPAVALDYSGGSGVQGTIFAMDFDQASRGAAIQFLSQYPHEEECAAFSESSSYTCHHTELRHWCAA